MQFYFIRHAQSQNNLLWEQTGSSKGRSIDAELTPLGQQQAEILAQFLRKNDEFGLTHLYTSLMSRAVVTGAAIAEALGLPLVTWEDLHETGGIYVEDEQTGQRTGQPGKNRADFQARFPCLILPDSLGEVGWWNRPFEEREQRLPRAQRFARELSERHGHTDDHVAVVSHGAFYNYFLSALLDWPRRDGYWFMLNNSAITRIDFNDRVALVYLNRFEHLPRELIT
jgi:2,3-bisphosphoglycerate-dependent phosphoglycerate mutase